MSPLAWAALDTARIVLAYLLAATLIDTALRLAQRRGDDPVPRLRWRPLAALPLAVAAATMPLIAGAPMARAAVTAGVGAGPLALLALALALAGGGLCAWIAANLHRLSPHRQPPARAIAAASAALGLLLLHYAGHTLLPGEIAARWFEPLVTLALLLIAAGLRGSLGTLFATRQARRRQLERRRLAEQERARLLTLRDPVTGLGNRTAFQQEVADFIRAANRSGGRFDLYHCDIGFATGTAAPLREQALAVLADRLRTCTRTEDRLIHYGDGQFVLLCARTGCGRDAPNTPVRERVLAACHDPIRVDGVRLSVVAQIGVATYPQHGATARQLMSAAMRLAERRVVPLRSSAA